MPSPATQILIVEDDPGLALLFGETLRHAGLTCTAVDSGRACIAWLETHTADLLLLDYSLPDMLAPALVEQLRQANRLPPFIVATGHGDERVAVEMMKRGARDYLVKDTQLFDRLSTAVNRTLRELEKEQQLAATEAALRKSEALFRRTFDEAPVGSAIVGLDRTFQRVNAALCRFLGYAAEELKGKSIADVTHPDDVLDSVAQIRRLLGGEVASFEIEKRYLRKDGAIVWGRVSVSLVRDGDDRPLHLAPIIQDITARKQAERELEQFFNLVPDMVCIASADGFFRKLNDEWVRVLGYSKEELMAVPYTEFVHPEDRAASRHETAQQAAGNPTISFVNRYRAKDGTYHWFEWNATATTSNGVLFAAARDITKHRLAEEAVRESELRYRTLANSGPGLVWTSGLDKKCDYFNQTWLAFTGRRLEQELGDGWVQGVHPEDLERCVATYVAAFDRRVRFSMDYRLRHHSGEYRWIQDDGSPRHDSQGGFLGYIGHCLDITERKRAGDALRESEEKFSKVFHDAPVWIAITDLETAQYLDVNEAVLRSAGFTREEVIGHTAASIGWITAADRARLKQAILAQGRITDLEMDFRTKDGCTLHGLVSGEQILLGGRPSLLTVTIDITERKRAEELIAWEAALVENSADICCVKDLDLRVRAVNSAFLRLAGAPSAAAVVGKTDAEIYCAPANATYAASFTADERHAQTLGPGQSILREEGVVLPDGTECLLLTRKFPVFDPSGRLIATASTSTDVTERKRAEDDRNRSHKLLAKLTAQVPGVVYQYRLFPDGRSCFPFASPGIQEIYEYEPEQVREDATQVFSRLHPEDAGAVSAAILESARTLAPFHCEFRVVLPRQGQRWRLSDAMPERTADGGTLWHGIISDITERKLAEAALRESLHEKEALLKEVHHRVKNNLQVISSLLRLESGRVVDLGTQSVLRDMQNRIRTMALLHESLYRSGNLAEVDMKAYLETLCQQLFRAASARSSGPVELQVAVAPMRLELNRTVPCGLIVNELVSNCLKHAFADGRGGLVRVALQPTPVPGEWGLRVADNGVGLPPGFTLENLPSLGLQLVSDLARQLQGRLEIGSGPEASAPAAFGPGAAFTVYFKVPLPEPRPAP